MTTTVVARGSRKTPRSRGRRASPNADLRALLDRAPDVVFRYRVWPEHRFDYVNRATTRVTGYTPDEFYADPRLVSTLVHPDDRSLVDDVLGRGTSGVPLVLRWLRKDRTVIWIEQRNTAVFDDTARLVAVEGIARAIPDPTTGSSPWIRIVGDMRIDVQRDLLLVGGTPVRLTPLERRLLVLLTDQPGGLVTRETIMTALWGTAYAGASRTAEVHISNLRRKIERVSGRSGCIETVRGRGYRFAAARR